MALLERLRISAYVICEDDDGRLLLARCIGWDDGPRWTLAGGGLDPGEQPRDGALRELTEETGYTGELEALIGVDAFRLVTTDAPPEGYDGDDFYAVRIVYRGRVTGGELTHEVDGTTDLAAWVPRDEIRTLDAVELVTIGVAMLDEPGAPVRSEPDPTTRTTQPASISDRATVVQRVAAYGRTPDGRTAGGILEHGADPAASVAAAFRATHGVDADVVRPRDATSTVDDGDGAARWVVTLEYDVEVR
ncbi:NUDIX hydrolase [Jiangella asiatica]|uniref:NUDIX hydrolase n=1 Tax=Jiangella asiatica TaxID=2530372 RepID=UPI00193DFD28|nr:NUDIX domain-containing protein [Jiangella asiatica]